MSDPIHLIAGKFPTQGGRPVLVTEEQFAACCCPPPPPPIPRISSFTITSLGVQDDDIRIRVGGVTVSDTKQRTGNAFPVRKITAALMAQLGIADARGFTVEVDVFDGWAENWRASPWTATIEFEDGSSVIKSGGSAQGPLPSSFRTPADIPRTTYLATGPHFSEYHANGSFTLSPL